MEAIYSNRFSITTNESKESFITFYLDIPKYNNKNEFVEMETIKTVMVILTDEAYGNFRNMLDKAEEKEESK